MTTEILHPRLRRRVPYFVLAVLLLALCVVAAFSSPVLGAVGVVFFGFAAVNGAFRLFHPRSYATELSPDGFRVYDSTGRKIHDVRWSEVEHLTVFNGNGFTGPGTVLHAAWRCRPRRPGHGRQRGCGAARTTSGSSTSARCRTPTWGSSRCSR